MAFTNITDFQYIGSGGELTAQEELFVQTLASRANYNANNVVVMNSNNGGSPGQVLRVNAAGTGLEWADIGGGGGGIGGTIATGQVAFGTATNTIGGDATFTFDSVSKKLSVSALKIGTLSGVLKASTGDVSGGATTSDLPEGTNLYYTNTRARNAISATAPITYNSTTGVIGLSTPLSISYGGTGLTSLGTANQILGVNNGTTGLEYKTLQGTANQINVVHSTGAITLSTPQDIATTSSPTFSGLTLTGNLNKINNVSYNWPSTQGGAGTVLTNDGSGNLSWSAGGSGGSVYSFWFVLNPINTLTWYIPYAVSTTSLSTLSLTPDRIYYIPFIPQINITINSLAIEVTTASAGTGQIGIYDTLNYRPNNLLASVNIDTGTTGVKSGTVNVSLQAGQLYWLALIVTGSPTVRSVPTGGISSRMGIATGGTAYNTHYYQAGSGGTLPATASANTNGTTAVPAIYIRYQ